MLALKEYGSSDENSGSDSEHESANSEVNCALDVESLPVEKSSTTSTATDMQICSAPEVVPMVNIFFWISLKNAIGRFDKFHRGYTWPA